MTEAGERERFLIENPTVAPSTYDLCILFGYEPYSWDGMWKLPDWEYPHLANLAQLGARIRGRLHPRHAQSATHSTGEAADQAGVTPSRETRARSGCA